MTKNLFRTAVFAVWATLAIVAHITAPAMAASDSFMFFDAYDSEGGHK